MKLLELTCDQPTFHSIRFKPEGLTLIVGDGALNKKDEGSSNGVGKTLALGLIHHCLGGDANKGLKQAVPDWMFRLSFSVNGKDNFVERSGDGKKILLNGRSLKIAELRDWLKDNGAFRLDPEISFLGFRALFKRFARFDRRDCDDPVHFYKEKPYQSLLYSLYLLGTDCSLVVNKHQHKVDIDALKQTSKMWQEDSSLKEVFRAGAQPKVRAEWLDREIPKLKHDLQQFHVAENYREIEAQTQVLTQQMRELEKQAAIVNFELSGINKALELQPDVSRTELMSLYEGIQSVFKPDVLAHFETVERFHLSLSINRKTRLEQDRTRLQARLESTETTRKRVAAQRDALLQDLAGKRALDEYAAIAKKLADFEEERTRLEEFLNFSSRLKEKTQVIKERWVEEDRHASEYLSEKPVEAMDHLFSEIAAKLYPSAPAGIVLENNIGDNQIRYDLSVHIEGEDSDGINAARIICFDWILMMAGANHTMDFLWHDNRLFADMSPEARASWFIHVLSALKKTGKQYIATLNTENLDAMRDHLSHEEQEELSSSIGLVLRGDEAKNKLLGIQFGSGK